MTSTERELARLLADLTPEPPRPISISDIARRVPAAHPPRPGRFGSWLPALAAAIVLAVAVAGGVLLVRSQTRDDRPRPAAPVVPTPVVSTSTGPARICAIGDLTAFVAQPSSPSQLVVGLRNAAAGSCSVRGFPAVTALVGVTPGFETLQLKTTVVHGSAPGAPNPLPTTIDLGRGQVATFAVYATSPRHQLLTALTIALSDGAESRSLVLPRGLSTVGGPDRLAVTALVAANAVQPAHDAMPQRGTVAFEGAVLTLPEGTSAWPITDGSWPTLCIGTDPSVTTTAACPILFRQIPPETSGRFVNADGLGGEPASNGPCGQTLPSELTLLASGHERFGNGDAELRAWTVRCQPGASFPVRQYVVTYAPGFVLYSSQATPAVAAQLASLAATASLPGQVASLPYSITGTVLSTSHHSDGYHVRLQPSVRGGASYAAVPNDPPANFVIPDRLVPPELEVSLTGPIGLETDGTVVTGLTIIGG